MAGVGPPPQEETRRRNKPEQHDVVSPTWHGPAPKLPKTYRAAVTTKAGGEVVRHRPFLKETRDWYEAWATGPMAARFAATDWNRLRLVIAPLFDCYVRLPAKDLAAELRLQETLLGATVMDRHRLRIRIASPGADAPAGGDGPPSPRDRAAAQRRARLSVVA